MRLHAVSHYTTNALDGSASIGYKALPKTYILMIEVGSVTKLKRGTDPALEQELAAWEEAATNAAQFHEHALGEVEAYKAEIAKRAMDRDLSRVETEPICAHCCDVGCNLCI